MKDFNRQHPEFSLCGLNCKLCPMHLNHYCPGCGGGEGHQSCAVIRCSRTHGDVEFCSSCAQFPCEKLEEATKYDSFITHRNMLNDLNRAEALGLDAYLLELAEKAQILHRLLDGYNDGRRKTFFCVAVNLMELADLQATMDLILDRTEPDSDVRQRARLAVEMIQDRAASRNLLLKLNKKPAKKK